MFKKLRDSGKLIDIVKLVLTYSKNVKTNMTLKQLIALANLANAIPDGSLTYFNIPGYNKTINGISYWVPDETETDKTLKKFFSQQ